MEIDEKRIAAIVEQVVAKMKSTQVEKTKLHSSTSAMGIYSDLDEALNRCATAQQQFMSLSLSKREQIIAAIRNAGIDNAEYFAHITHEETRLGRYEDKIQKNINAAKLTPGMEVLTRRIIGGDDGVTIIEHAPFGLIVSITPTTHPTPFIINHAIIMLAGGNSVFFCPHPRAQNCTRTAITVLNKAIVEAGGPLDLLTALDKVSMDAVQAACTHKLTSMVTAAGGPGVVDMALSCGKKAIAAGPGNPPVVVDETADLANTARDIVAGASFDNNILCIAEKEIFVVDAVADQFIHELRKNKAYVVEQSKQIEQLTNLLVKDGHINRDYVGQDADKILAQIQVHVDPSVRLVVFETDFAHPLVKIEQMLPVLPIVRARDFSHALQMAIEAEQGLGHTAVIHSSGIHRITQFTREVGAGLTVANGPSGTALGVGGAAEFAHTIADPTGEGIVTAKHFTREHRLTINGALNIS
ncbi:MAG: aldehyde dehydrogenase [Limnochordia bacterium]|nr:aldehyde dehydrogenase [Limnochordia bacterium]